MTPKQLIKAHRLNAEAADVVSDYIFRRSMDTIDIALIETADYWGADVVELAIYLSDRIEQDKESLLKWFRTGLI